jgi:hypothetical protein
MFSVSFAIGSSSILPLPIKSASTLFSPDRQMFLREKKAVSLLFSEGYLTPRGWVLELDSKPLFNF